jgi:uncharacterized SAM-binding protein YcdF (DUF218 family)
MIWVLRLFALLMLLWIIGFIWFAIDLPRPASDGVETDSVVVLTGGPDRISRGLAVIEAKQAQRLLISGVDTDVKPRELAQEYDRPRALFSCCVDLGFEAVDTRSNALETAGWLKERGDQRVRLVTSDWHMRRARLELERVLPGTITIISDAVPSQPSLHTLLLEYHKYVMREAAARAGS